MSFTHFAILLWAVVATYGVSRYARAYLTARDELRAIKRQRSSIVSRGNVTRALNAKAKRDQITAALRGEG